MTAAAFKFHSLPHISRAQECARQIESDAEVLPSIGFHAPAQLKRKIKRAAKLAKRSGDLRGRQRRAEIRAAASAVIFRFLAVSDIASGTVQYPLAVIAKECGLNRRRVDRVIALLRRAGILQTVRRPVEIHRGKIIPRVAVRRWGTGFLNLAGVGKLWATWRQRRAEQRAGDDFTKMATDGEVWETRALLRRARKSIKRIEPPAAEKPPPKTPADYGARSWLEVIKQTPPEGAGD